MAPTDIIAILAILLIVGSATAYIVKAKKSGKKCIGCPDSDTCTKGSCCHAPEAESEITDESRACGGCNTCPHSSSCPSMQKK